MRVNDVTASAFGPLIGESLSFAPGMTVVVGDNESAKSTWHAAIYAALCGRRRGKGVPPKDERRFADLHRPWDDSHWVVSANITLDNGSRVQMYQDLNGKVDCRAHDMDMGAADISSEIMFEGSPDASRWLGLDRRSFASTACVNQAELLKVLDDAGGLQEHLQRAAATAGTTDATAAAALACLAAFSRDFVGTRQANSTKPLRRALVAADAAHADLVVTLAAHEKYLALVTGADHARELAAAKGDLATAAQSRATALEFLESLARVATAAAADVTMRREHVARAAGDLATAAATSAMARTLDEQFAGQAPAGTLAGADHATAVAAALAAYHAPGTAAALAGATSEALAAALATLPSLPTGDTAVAPAVRTAAAELATAAALVAATLADQPPPLPEAAAAMVAATTAGPELLRTLARDLVAPPPPLGPDSVAAANAAEAAVTAATAELLGLEARVEHGASGGTSTGSDAPGGLAAHTGTRTRPSRALTLAALAGAVLAGAGALTGRGVVLIAGLVLVLAVAVVITWRRSSPSAPTRAVASTGTQVGDAAGRAAALAAARERLLELRISAASATGRRDAGAQRAAEQEGAIRATAARTTALGLSPDPAELRALAAAVEARAAAGDASRAWAQRHLVASASAGRAAVALAVALDTRQAPPDSALASRLQRYEQDCAARAARATLAGQRSALTREHAARLGADRAATALLAAGAVLDLAPGPQISLDELASALERWADQRRTEIGSTDGEQAAWAQLQAALGGRTLADLEAHVADLAASQVASQAGLDAAQVRAGDAAGAVEQARTGLAEQFADVSGPADITGALTATRAVLRTALAEASAAGRAAADADGTCRERARSLPPVAEAEERLATAQAELDRVSELDATLATTRDFLEAAQQRVHHDIAPVLEDTLTAWLPSITAGRYVRAKVDPRTLQVQICGPTQNWRHVDRLSHGTAEQVYLLLRVALARHLTKAGTLAPLLLDDVTVQADSTRTAAILNLLHELSAGQQVILFAAQAQVADWARENLTGPNDKVIELGPLPRS